MKALLVAENDQTIEKISMVLKSVGYDTIVYKWLLKALDNIEEIAPHLILISTKDYPRHWKTLTQYASIEVKGYKPEVVLFTGGDFSDEEIKKADALHVRGFFDSVTVEGLEKLRKILAIRDDIYSGEPEKFADTDEKTDNCDNSPDEDEQFLNEPDDSMSLDSFEEETVKNDSDKAADEIEDADSEEIINEKNSEEENIDKADDEIEDADSEDTDEEIPDIFSDWDSEDDEIPTVSAILKNTEENTMTQDEIDISEKLAEIMGANKADAKAKQEEFSEPQNYSVSFVFTNPITLAMVTGSARNYNGMTLEFTPDIPNFIMNLDTGTRIDIASIKIDDKIENVRAEVMSNDKEKLYLQIKK